MLSRAKSRNGIGGISSISQGTTSSSIGSRKGTKAPIRRTSRSTTALVVGSVILILLYWFWHLTELIHQDRDGKSLFRSRKFQLDAISQKQHNRDMQFCQFRRYPLHRYYKINKPLDQQPEFLVASDVEYIYGRWPLILPLSNDSLRLSKLCVDQTEWHPHSTEMKTDSVSSLVWPFADGTNPSILLFDRIQIEAPKVYESLVRVLPSAYALVTVCMTNSQCTWKDVNSDAEKYDLPSLEQKQPNTVRTNIQVLDSRFQKLAETTISLKRDAPWGKKVKATTADEKIDPFLPALDDARLFLYGEQIFVSYREGPGFGYESQVLNPIHFHHSTETYQLSATIFASETASFCCGRNMALLNVPGATSLAALTWVDPVTVEHVDTTPIFQTKKTTQRSRRRLVSLNRTLDSLQHRRLKEKPHKSHIHGTNGFMIPMPGGKEFLGVAHFHRPSDRKPNPFARFGHHYTHAFYTISAIVDSSPDAFRLRSLSQEFVIPSFHQREDAEIIQFISGLEYDSRTKEVILSYGVNDCEGVVRAIPLSMVQEMLRPVSRDGMQVVDFMLPLQMVS